MNVIKALFPVALLVAGAAPLAGQDAKVGVQAAIAFPVNDLTNAANMGLSLGGHLRWDFGHGHGLMARGDLGFYGSKDGFSTNSYAVGADYTYHLDHNRRGVYLLAGLSYMGYHLSRSGDSASRSALGPDFGIGMDVTRNVGLQIRYTSHKVENANFNSLNLGGTYTF